VASCLAIVSGQRVTKSRMDAFVNQNAHLGARDGRKSLRKVFPCFSALEVVEERLDGDTGSAEHTSSTKNRGS
jgi:hypothetical protein